MKEIIASLLSKELKKSSEEILRLIEVPPQSDLGDYAFPCFSLAKEQKKNPLEIAKNIALNIKSKELEKVESKGPYVNFFINKKILAEQALKIDDKFGKSNLGKGKKIVVDMSSPNIAKPFGIGHLRSTIIGNSLSRLSEFLGYKSIKINYLGDWGTQFGKLIVGYKKFGNPSKLKSDPINHMLEIYVKANAEEYEEEARKWFKKLEEGDKEALKFWKTFRDYSLKDFNKIYKILGVKFDVFSGESFYNNRMSRTIEELRSKKLLKESEGALVVDLEKYGLGVCLIQKSDGATLYATRDITAAIDRYKTYGFERMIYEVGNEQKLHLSQFFKILELLGYSWAKDCVHVGHGMYLGEDGKRFRTRKGKTVFMSDILNETIELAKKTIQEKNPKLKKKDEIARKVAIAAIFYGDLKNHRNNDILFDIDKFLDFEGDSGPYLQYSYARASSIMRKAKAKKEKVKIENVDEKEFTLIKKILQFPEVVNQAYNSLSPHIIANYSLELCQIFNDFYHSCPVLGNEKQAFRLKLVDSFRKVLKNSLSLLGIEAIEEM